MSTSESSTPTGPEAAESDTDTADAQTTTTVDSEAAGLTADERNELERLRAIHKDEKKWESRAKANFDDAQKYRALSDVFGEKEANSKGEFDAQAAIKAMRDELESERTERTRADVAREKGIDPVYATGKTREEMTAAADRYLDDVQKRIEAALTKATAPATESTSTVKSGDRVEGPKQITSEAELKKLPPAEQLAAYKDGRLNKLLGRD